MSELGGVPIDYRQLDFVKEIHRLTGERVDGVGGTHIWRSCTALRPSGTVVAEGGRQPSEYSVTLSVLLLLGTKPKWPRVAS